VKRGVVSVVLGMPQAGLQGPLGLLCCLVKALRIPFWVPLQKWSPLVTIWEAGKVVACFDSCCGEPRIRQRCKDNYHIDTEIGIPRMRVRGAQHASALKVFCVQSQRLEHANVSCC
jgi:hypothetical protein